MDQFSTKDYVLDSHVGPSPQFITFNMDGSALGNQNVASGGGPH